MEGFKAEPHGMRRIGEASMGEGVAHQQVAVFVVNARDRAVQERERGESDSDDAEKQAEHDEIAAFCG